MTVSVAYSSLSSQVLWNTVNDERVCALAVCMLLWHLCSGLVHFQQFYFATGEKFKGNLNREWSAVNMNPGIVSCLKFIFFQAPRTCEIKWMMKGLVHGLCACFCVGLCSACSYRHWIWAYDRYCSWRWTILDRIWTKTPRGVVSPRSGYEMVHLSFRIAMNTYCH